MRISLYIGFAILGISVLVSLFLQELSILFILSCFIGVVSIILSGIFSGVAFNTGDRIRANYYTETKEDKKQKTKISLYLLIIGLPSIITAILIYLVFSRMN